MSTVECQNSTYTAAKYLVSNDVIRHGLTNNEANDENSHMHIVLRSLIGIISAACHGVFLILILAFSEGYAFFISYALHQK